MLTRGAFTNQLLIFSLFALCLILLGEFVIAQKSCTNSASGQIYLDADRDGIFEPDEQRVPGSISVHARLTGKSITYDSADGTFSTGDITCDIYDVKYNSIAVGYFEVSEVVSPVIHSFPITHEALTPGNIPREQFLVYLPVVKR